MEKPTRKTLQDKYDQAVYLMNQHLIPYERTAGILDDFYGVKISTETLFSFNKTVFNLLEKPLETIKSKLINSAVLYVDETGCRVEKGRCHWSHTAGTNGLTYYFFHEKRGAEGIDAMTASDPSRGMKYSAGLEVLSQRQESTPAIVFTSLNPH